MGVYEPDAIMSIIEKLISLNQKASPAPWKVADDVVHDVYSNDLFVAQMRGWGHLTSLYKLSDKEALAVQEANANLIVEMRNALSDMLTFIQKQKNEITFLYDRIRALNNEDVIYISESRC
jgi:hypothetical protein